MNGQERLFSLSEFHDCSGQDAWRRRHDCADVQRARAASLQSIDIGDDPAGLVQTALRILNDISSDRRGSEAARVTVEEDSIEDLFCILNDLRCR